MSERASHELHIDLLRCDAYGYCAELLPDIIERDEWGYPIVTREIGGSRLAAARRAAEMCPVLALRLAATGRGRPHARLASS